MTSEQAGRARELAALGVGQRGIAAELGLSRRQVAAALAEVRTAPSTHAPPPTAASAPPALPLVELPELIEPELPPAPLKPTPRVVLPRAVPPAPSTAPTPLELREQREERYREQLERARLGVEAHGYRGAPTTDAYTRGGAVFHDRKI